MTHYRQLYAHLIAQSSRLTTHSSRLTTHNAQPYAPTPLPYAPRPVPYTPRTSPYAPSASPRAPRAKRTPRHKLLLYRTSGYDKMSSLGGKPHIKVGGQGVSLCNTPLKALVALLNRVHAQRLFIDLTGYLGPVDIILQAPLGDWAAICTELHSYDLDIMPLAALPLGRCPQDRGALTNNQLNQTHS